MELRQLRYFVAVAEAKGLTAAVETLFIAQPALSQSIKQLEEELGIKLFNRSRKGMELTSAGSAFFDHANLILRQVVRAKESLDDFEKNPSGSVSIAMPSSVNHVLSAPLFKSVHERYPKIILNLEEVLAFDVRKAFDLEMYDLLVYFQLREMDNISVEPLIEEQLLFASAYSDKNMLSDEIDLSDLEGCRVLFPRLQYGGIFAKLAEENGVKVNISRSTAGIHTIIDLVKMGVTSALLPATMIRSSIENKTIMAARVVNPSVTRTINLIVPSNRPRSSATNAVMQVVREVVQELHCAGKWPGNLLVKDQQE
jgi:LysR family nitrogen assimilation transcriptional regulator